VSDSKNPLVASFWLILIGVGWLLNTTNVVPGVNWIWTLGLAVLGLAMLIMGGINKVTVVLGAFLLCASLLSVVRQTGRLSVEHELPCLMIALGVLLLAAHLAPIPLPVWLKKSAD
jgi:hypothetical protein